MKSAREAIALHPVNMTEEVMEGLEKGGLIIRLAPDRHRLETPRGQTKGKSLYECDPRYGPHKLITVTVNRASFEAFGTHPDNEDFLLLGDPSSRHGGSKKKCAAGPCAGAISPPSPCGSTIPG